MHQRIIPAALVTLLAAAPAAAGQRWLEPQSKDCNLGPGDVCRVEVTCPDDLPYVVAGGGGIPKVGLDDHDIAMTMNLPVSPHVWRVQWNNLGIGLRVDATVAVRVLCSDDASIWGQ